MAFLQFIITYWDSALICVALTAAVVGMYARGELASLQDVLFRLVTRAEKEYGTGTGALKLAAVLEWAYEKLPPVVRAVLPSSVVKRLVEDALAAAKAKWAANPKLAAYVGSVGN